jgi:hypothetical protein
MGCEHVFYYWLCVPTIVGYSFYFVWTNRSCIVYLILQLINKKNNNLDLWAVKSPIIDKYVNLPPNFVLQMAFLILVSRWCEPVEAWTCMRSCLRTLLSSNTFPSATGSGSHRPIASHIECTHAADGGKRWGPRGPWCNTHFLQIIKFCQISSALGCILNNSIRW